MPPYFLPSCYIRAAQSTYAPGDFAYHFELIFLGWDYTDDDGAWVFLIGA